ncbi:hypothetical protein GCM10010168_29610 [Actinoplanes ianthinogenes]|uniref:DUF6891 domain-containing protein n=1 Tax=Actinoplanes ianthinogenes TaxID=122358 RepID=A0ABM7LLQ8_9ACTN|nr:hypothetical protein [Actinoplanes ianthinogenes]BCJ40103.1 hypothetical protein Aiant_07600 [Actinoplanes ianthinogenes]GGR10293.1 hypothetical protein GCM10010168_29610 [Actinoplanes ianthinogenes]
MSAWPYNDRPDGVRFLPDHIDEPGRTEIEDEIWAWIVRGEDDPAEFVDYLDEGRHGATEEELEDAYTKALDVRRDQQRGFGEVNSNLTLAFDELNDLGVLAREDFTCCGTCAAAEIHDERDDSRHWRGYLWYHQQDTESLAESDNGSVYVGYGAYPPADLDAAAYEALSQEEKQARYQSEVEHLMDDVVFPVLQKHGIQVTWNRNLGTRILLTGAHWYAPLD